MNNNLTETFNNARMNPFQGKKVVSSFFHFSFVLRIRNVLVFFQLQDKIIYASLAFDKPQPIAILKVK